MAHGWFVEPELLNLLSEDTLKRVMGDLIDKGIAISDQDLINQSNNAIQAIASELANRTKKY